MATDLVDLQDQLNIATAQTLDELTRESLLLAGVALFNAEVTGPVTVDGTLLSRELTPYEQRLVVLFSVLAYMDGEILKASMNAIVHRNDAGRTDLSQIPLRMGAARKDLYDNQVKPMLAGLYGGASAGVLEEAVAFERGETLHLVVPPYTTAVTWPWW